MIDPRNGLNGFTAWSVIDHHEREELLRSRGDRDDIPPFRDCAIYIITYESFRELDLVSRIDAARLSICSASIFCGGLESSATVFWGLMKIL